MSELPANHFNDTGIGITCSWCHNALCAPASPCRCCLQVEVEVLRAQVQRVRELCDRAVAATEAYNQPLTEHERRLGRPSTGIGVATVDASNILHILDGGDA